MSEQDDILSFVRLKAPETSTWWEKWPPEVQLPRSWFWAWQAGNDSTSSYKLPLLGKTEQQQQQQKRCWKELKLLFQGVTQGSLPGPFYFHFLSRVLSFTPCTSYKFSVQQEKLCAGAECWSHPGSWWSWGPIGPSLSSGTLKKGKKKTRTKLLFKTFITFSYTMCCEE